MLNRKGFASAKWKHAVAAGLLCLAPHAALAQQDVFAPGWTLDSETSTLRFQSVKNETKVESSTFGTYTGMIDESGLATIRISLDSVDTNVDLRNVRMRFLLFETFQFPEAVVTMQIDPTQLEDLPDVRRKVMNVTYSIDLHGVASEREAEIAVTLLEDDRVSVTSSTPISLPVIDFGLEEGIAKLEAAAKVEIIPSATVTFDFTFNRAATAAGFKAASVEMAAAAGFTEAALEDSGDFSYEACAGRFENLSRTDDISFSRGGSTLEASSGAVLDSIAEIINRCPDLRIRVDGHTDSDGSEALNQALSEARAQSVRSYLIEAGVEDERVEAFGFGETVPLVENDTDENKQRNRRIEFSVITEQASL